jgi:hypothetical protein
MQKHRRKRNEVAIIQAFPQLIGASQLNPGLNKKEHTAMSSSEGVIEKACLGPPFRLGMLYDCRSDNLIPGMTLWNNERLKSARPQIGSDFEVIAEDTLESKASQLKLM